MLPQTRHTQAPPPLPTSILRGHLASITALSYLSFPFSTPLDNKKKHRTLLISGDTTTAIRIWDTALCECLITVYHRMVLPSVSGGVRNIVPLPRMSSDASHEPCFFSLARDGSLRSWKVSCNKDNEISVAELGLSASQNVQRDPDGHIHHQPLFMFGSGFAGIDCRGPQNLGLTSNSTTTHTLPNVSVLGVSGHDDSKIILIGNLMGENPAEIGLKTFPSSQAETNTDKWGMCFSVRFHPNPQSSLIFAAYEDGVVRVWNTHTGALVAQLKVQDEPLFVIRVVWQHALYSVPDQQQQDHDQDRVVIFAAGATNIISVRVFYQSHFLACPVLTKDVVVKAKGISDLMVRNDGRIIVTTGWDGKIRVFDGKSNSLFMRPLAVLDYHQDGLNCCAYMNDSKQFVAAGKDKKISVWSIYS